MNLFAARLNRARSFLLLNKSGLVAGYVFLWALSLTSCATRRSEPLSSGIATGLGPRSAVLLTSNSSKPGVVETSGAGVARSSRIEPNASAIPLASATARGVENSAGVPTLPAVEEWLALQLGPGVVVRRGSAGMLVISRPPPKEPLPLFQEAIVLGELRAIVRSSNMPGDGEVTFRNGVVSVTTTEPLQSRRTASIVSEILDFPEVSEVRLQARQAAGG